MGFLSHGESFLRARMASLTTLLTTLLSPKAERTGCHYFQGQGVGVATGYWARRECSACLVTLSVIPTASKEDLEQRHGDQVSRLQNGPALAESEPRRGKILRAGLEGDNFSEEARLGGRIGVNSVVEASRSDWQGWVVGSEGSSGAHRGTRFLAVMPTYRGPWYSPHSNPQPRSIPPTSSLPGPVGFLICGFLQTWTALQQADLVSRL